VDRVTLSSLRRCIAARDVLSEELRMTDHNDPDFPELLRLVRDSRLFTGAELAELVGLSRARLYELLAE
jgi:hypothetical protein